MGRSRYLWAVALTVYAGTAFSAVSAQGEEYTESLINKNIILKSQNNKIIIKPNCVAVSKKYGKGTWEQPNGGFLITFKNNIIAFPHQEIDLLANNKCGY